MMPKREHFIFKFISFVLLVVGLVFGSANATSTSSVSKNKALLMNDSAQINAYKQLTNLTAQNPEVKAFINMMVKKHGFDRQTLMTLFNQVSYQPKIISLMERPAEKRLTWGEYRAIFMRPSLISRGIEFWTKNHAALEKAERVYGVSPVAVMGILGVETRFGRITGGYRAVDALSTLGFAYPPRAQFFKKELVNLLILSRKESMDPLSLTGSYAGALGMPQFMPSSYLAYAVDFNNSKKADIWQSPEDAIGSVANYLKQHGWERGKKIVVAAEPEGQSYRSTLSKTMPLAEAVKKGMKNTQWLPSDTEVTGLELDGKRGPQYWLTTKNFYAITRYNRSNLYAMAVYELGSAIERDYQNVLNQVADSK